MLITQKKPHPNLFPRQLILSFLFVVTFISCRVSLVPEYSATLETQIINGAKMTDMLYLQMINAPAGTKNFALWSDKYLAVEAEINSILLKEQARLKADDIIASVKLLHDHFVAAKDDHHTRDTLKNGEFLVYNEELKAFWLPVLKEEIALSQVK